MTTRITETILLVAGTGSRLRPLTERTHKSMLEVGGEPLLFRLLAQLADRGIRRATLATGYLHDQIRSALGEHDPDLEVAYAHNPDYASTNNAESLRLALEETDDEPVLLCDGDILVRRPDWVETLLERPQHNTLAVLDHDSIAEEEMKVRLAAAPDADEPPVEALSKAIPPARADAESIGVQTLSASFLPVLRERLAVMSDAERADAYYEDIFADLIEDGHRFFTTAIPGGDWTEIDTPADLEAARRMADDWSRPRG